MISAADEGLHAGDGPGFSDAVTVAFGDPQGRLYGLARIGLRPGPPAEASALAVLFSGTEVVDALAAGGSEAADPGWDSATVGPLAFATAEPLGRWRASWAGRGGGFELDLEALTPPLEMEAGGVRGYEQVCRVEGTVALGDGERRVSCLGQRGHGWGAVDWERIALARTVSAWWDPGHALALSAVRPAGAEHHDQEQLTAYLVEARGDGEAAEVRAVNQPRLSTTYDAEGRHRRAGLELWLAEDDEVPRRAAGTAACGTTLELGRLRLDCAFFDWRMEGRSGVGRYDVLRRA
jgi:hypothetical protein